ncbi:hypothetical protein C7441_11075 [Pseudaminobacter salicylatoxidans]|uniref:Methyltransferase family protein n=1 Tax=Pseudaminobacter salicylatoxidans TaxID=93369 RepID=A0A316C0K5_PSESE|nr:hypothetical protein [Pseudaminobacter salicylatoxidans]PWJ81543.1 hypothetical protein C7441_11075 [Pseudaminobacter salicylatoxidans]
MGKRSSFPRRPQDAYDTPADAVPALIPHLVGVRTFAEPCAGNGYLIRHLSHFGLECIYSSDIKEGVNALDVSDFGKVDAVITNPPWSRDVLHAMILHFQAIAPTWLLFDADWAYTSQAGPFLDQCSHIVAVGRLKWIEGSKHTGKDNAAWFRFHAQHVGGPKLIGKRSKTELAVAA